jgi:UDP-glucose:(heptosyl)LPS alpha-1,3-glucosyltransferase
MKIVLIRKEYTLSWGGAESYVVNLSKHLCDLGHEVHVFANSWDTVSDSRIIFHHVPMVSFYSPLKNLTFAFNVRHLLKREHFDIVNGFSQVYPQDIYRMGDGLHLHFLHTHYTSRVKRFLHYLNPRHLTILFIERQIFSPKNYYYVVANSEMCKRQAVNYYQVPEERIEVIYNGVDGERFNPEVRERYCSAIRKRLNISEKEQVILFVSRNYGRKGLHLLIECLPLLKEKENAIKLVVVGRGDPAPYQRLASNYGLKDRLLFVGEEKILEQYYGAADLLVLPTLYDPFSNVCLEALACGLPVITTRSNGAAELIEEGKNGYLIKNARDKEELAQKIALLLREEVSEETGRNAAASVTHYTIAENAKKTLALYEKVIKEKTRFSCSRHDGVMVNDEYASLLLQNNLTGFDTFMCRQNGKIIKQTIKDRSTVRLILKNTTGEVGVYLKRYYTPDLKTRIKSLAHFSLPKTALHEWNNILAFHQRGIPTMIPLSVGVREHVGLRRESFLLTKEIQGVERLEDYLLSHFSPPLTSQRLEEKRALIRELAVLVKRMHQAGFNHRDLYLCHILVKRDSSPNWKIYFADLHRVDQRRKVGERWMVKDLAALNYSASETLITRADRVRFLKEYLGQKRLDLYARNVIRKVLKKSDKIRSHDFKIRERACLT